MASRCYCIASGGLDGAEGGLPNCHCHNDIGVNHRKVRRSADRCVLADLKSRGMLVETLGSCVEILGVRPISHGSKGRDHNPNAFNVWMARVGIQGGVQDGASDDFGCKAVEKRVGVDDLQPNLLHLLGMDHERLTYRFNERDHRLLRWAAS